MNDKVVRMSPPATQQVPAPADDERMLLAELLSMALVFMPAHALADSVSRLLNSERIELKFGSYGIDVLENTDHLRVSNLYSERDGLRITRTFAVISYPEQLDPFLEGEHAAIRDGQSIGAAFRFNGWEVHKRHLYFGELDHPEAGWPVWQMMGGAAPQPLAVHVYVLDVERSGQLLHYATIAEVHHPEYLTLEGLASVYGDEFAQHRDPAACAVLLDQVREEMSRPRP